MKIMVALLLATTFAAACNNSRKEPVQDNTPAQQAGDGANNEAPDAPPFVLKIDTLNSSEIPASFKRKGDIKFAYRWTDQNGVNMLTGSVVAPGITRAGDAANDPQQASYLYASQYVQSGDTLKLLWDIQDKVADCEFDITLKFKPGGVYITDLDSNRLTETTLVYLLTCRSDVSPAEMKLIMHEGDKKMALRGLGAEPGTQTVYTEKDICCADKLDMKAIEANYEYQKLWAKYKNENEFSAAPPAFLPFARKAWLKHVYER